MATLNVKLDKSTIDKALLEENIKLKKRIYSLETKLKRIENKHSDFSEKKEQIEKLKIHFTETVNMLQNFTENYGETGL